MSKIYERKKMIEKMKRTYIKGMKKAGK